MGMSIKHAPTQRRRRRYQSEPTKHDLDEISRALVDERDAQREDTYDLSIEDTLEDWPETAGEEDRWLLARVGWSDEERNG